MAPSADFIDSGFRLRETNLIVLVVSPLNALIRGLKACILTGYMQTHLSNFLNTLFDVLFNNIPYAHSMTVAENGKTLLSVTC